MTSIRFLHFLNFLWSLRSACPYRSSVTGTDGTACPSPDWLDDCHQNLEPWWWLQLHQDWSWHVSNSLVRARMEMVTPLPVPIYFKCGWVLIWKFPIYSTTEVTRLIWDICNRVERLEFWKVLYLYFYMPGELYSLSVAEKYNSW